jgi:hypothetical protein
MLPGARVMIAHLAYTRFHPSWRSKEPTCTVGFLKRVPLFCWLAAAAPVHTGLHGPILARDQLWSPPPAQPPPGPMVITHGGISQRDIC